MKKIIVLVEKVLVLVLVCFFISKCTESEGITETVVKFEINRMDEVNLKEDLKVISHSTDMIKTYSESRYVAQVVNCHLDYNACVEEGTCDVSVVCDRDVRIEPSVIQAEVEYVYGKFSEIPEFNNNFTDGEYHGSDVYPMLLTIKGYCESAGDIHIGNNWIDCNELQEGYDQTYVEYPIDLMYPNYEHIYRMTYYDAITEPNSHKWLSKPESRHPDYKYIEAEQLELLEEAMNELELIAFYPHYLRYYYNEEDCHNRYYSFMYELDGDEPFALDGDKVVVSVTQYEDLDVAFVSVEAPEYDDSFNVYVKVNDFFKIIDEMMGEANITEYGYGCPIVE